jgi:hypothetical protein
MTEYMNMDDGVKAINTWMEQNQETILYYMKLIALPQEQQEQVQDQTIEVRQYKPRKYRIRATEHERAVSRAYYVAHREEILEKRRLYNLKLKANKNKGRPTKT